MTQPLAKIHAIATEKTGKICNETDKVVDMTGAPFEAPVEQKLQPPKQETDRFAHTKSWPALSHGFMPFANPTTQMQQQQQSGGLLNLSDAERAASRARQEACIASMPKNTAQHFIIPL